MITVAQLLGRNQRLLFTHRLRQYQREHAGQPRQVSDEKGTDNKRKDTVAEIAETFHASRYLAAGISRSRGWRGAP